MEVLPSRHPVRTQPRFTVCMPLRQLWNLPLFGQRGVAPPLHRVERLKYLYLRENFLKLEEKGGDSVRTEEINVNGERRHKITDVIGLQDGLHHWRVLSRSRCGATRA
ncbi:hypothetical protein DFH07DRAFT_233882 [Mycena maculata]|uniref:Uncharacterized protein n=1 Tax=Mycena maculata TaxID=230809 RepID=A0AAD7HS60_9AGAR|nr:hypothetical protein DFH07DRAFT_234025 [Mycena maculata]KAJ7727152.1 hypothetical protein DFH07DRAFT_233882 [Mycena maculata]